MIIYEISESEEPRTGHARCAVLEALTPIHLIRPYKDLADLREFLDEGLEDMRKAKLNDQIPADMPIALTRVWLFYINKAAVDLVVVRMSQVGEFNKWPQPDGWLGFYERIDQLRAVARRYDPEFVPLHV